MSGDFFSAVFGKLFTRGTAIELRGGLNFEGGIEVVPDASGQYNNVRITPTGFPLLLPVGAAKITQQLGQVDTMSLNASEGVRVSGSYAESLDTETYFAPTAFGCGLTYTGPAARALIYAGSNAVANNPALARISVNGTLSAPVAFNGTTRVHVFELASLATNDVISFELIGNGGSASVDVSNSTLIVALIPMAGEL